jgi:hypothetical protein
MGTWNDQYTDCLREFICEVPCYEIKQIAGPPCGSLFPCGTTKVTYVATQGAYHDTCSFNVTVKCNNTEIIANPEVNGAITPGSRKSAWAILTITQEIMVGMLISQALVLLIIGGKTYSLCLTPGFGGPTYQVYWKVWIDYNADGDFYDTDELVAYGTGTGSFVW